MQSFTIRPARPLATIDDDTGVFDRISGHFHHKPIDAQEELFASETIRRLVHDRVAVGGISLKNLSGYADFRTGNFRRQFSTRLTYYNYTEGQVVVYERDGVPLILEPDTRRSGYEESCVVIRKEILFDDRKAVDRTISALRSLGDLSGADLKCVRNHLEKNVNQVGFHGYRIELEYALMLSELQKSGGAVYHRKTDSVISIATLRDTPKHPYSAECMRLGKKHPDLVDADSDLNITIRYVNHDLNAEPLYVNIANKVLEIRSQSMNPEKIVRTDNKRKGGESSESCAYVEFIYADPNSTGLNYSRVSVEDAMESHGLFSSRGEAINAKATLEQVIRHQKQRIESLEAQSADKLREQTNVHIEQMRTLNEKLRDKESTIQSRNDEIDRLKQALASKADEHKEKRETQAHKQKVSFEMVKFVISVVTMLIGIIPLVLKLKTAKPA